jgi:hypothetical protein
VIPLFLGVTIFNLLCLAITASLGYVVMLRGPALGPYHQLAGVLATLACCAVHCIVFTYFAATSKWIQHAIDVKHLDPKLATPTRSFKAQAFPAALAAMSVVFLAAVAGAITFNYGVRPIWHHVMALLAIGVNVWAATVEFRAIKQNGRLIDELLERINGPAAKTAA